MRTIRMFVPNRKGRAILRLTDADITHSSVIQIAVSESTPLGPANIGGQQNFFAKIGDASISVENICPLDGRVEFVVNVNFGVPLNVVCDITIVSSKPDALVIGT